ncbi:MAG: adenylyl-sulfate kinase [Gammaproteobacteria bacterium]|nr:adenylyl-sulfate kinase [Gammaproteobacteria bacterium]
MVVKKTFVYWITGLSGAGKSTLCRKLVAHLREQDRPVVMLDGDELREALGAGAAYTRNELLALAKRYAHLCHLIAVQGFDVAIATISLFREVHEWNRVNLPGYVEIFLDVSMDELSRRDPKKIYERAAKGELQSVAGVDFVVEYPEAPDVLLAWHENLTEESAFNELLNKLAALGVA